MQHISSKNKVHMWTDCSFLCFSQTWFVFTLLGQESTPGDNVLKVWWSIFLLFISDLEDGLEKNKNQSIVSTAAISDTEKEDFSSFKETDANHSSTTVKQKSIAKSADACNILWYDCSLGLCKRCSTKNKLTVQNWMPSNANQGCIRRKGLS